MKFALVFCVPMCLIASAASAAAPTVPGSPLPLGAGEVWCCNTERGRWYAPPEVSQMSMRPEVCWALSPVAAPQGTSEAAACATDPKQPKEPPPPPPRPVEIKTTVENGTTVAWTVDCSGKVFDIMKIPESAWSDANIDRFDKLVGEFESVNGILITYEFETEPDPAKPGHTRVKRDRNGKPKVKWIKSRSTGPASGPTGGKNLCDFLRDLI